MAEPLVVGILFTQDFDQERFLARTAGLGRPVEVLVASYEEDHALRMAKRQRRDPAGLRAMAPPVPTEVVDVLARAEAVLAVDLPLDVLALAPRLRLVQAIGAGVGQFDEAALWAGGVSLATAAGVGAPPIAEFVIGRVLQVWKGFRHLEDLQRQHVWQFTPGRLLAGTTIGIVGLGAIGTAVAERAGAFGMRVLAIRRSHRPGVTSPVADELLGPAQLPRLLRESDVVVLCAPETDETRGLIGADQLALMKPASVLCNVARGGLVDEGALLDALSAGRLGAAILDVVAEEPLPADSPLWSAPNLYLSSHSAASQDGYGDRLGELFATNLGRYVRGEPLVNLVSPERGY